jgi:bacteriorhodopsin
VCEQVLEQLAAESLAPTACTTIKEVGSTGVGALTIAFLILGVSTIVFITRVGSAKGQKVYYYCNVFICGFATMSYFAMLSGQGWTAIAGCRQFFYARYVDWSITTPLLLLDLGLIAGADGALIAAVIGADGEFVFAARIVIALCVFLSLRSLSLSLSLSLSILGNNSQQTQGMRWCYADRASYSSGMQRK